MGEWKNFFEGSCVEYQEAGFVETNGKARIGD